MSETQHDQECRYSDKADCICKPVAPAPTASAREWLTDNFYFGEDEIPTLIARRSFKWNLEVPLDEVLEAYASSQSSKLEGVGQEAAEKIWADLKSQSYPQVKALDSGVVEFVKRSWAAIIDELIAGRLKP